MKKTFLYIAAAMMLTACGSSKKLAGNSGTATTAPSTSVQPTQSTILQKVKDNMVYTQNIVADLDFTLAADGREITVGGSLHMKKDDVIRIQLVAFGLMEVGRLEFTKDYVLIQDKFHKQYIKEDYNQVSFLKDNGLDFYALQALLWNQLYVPGTAKVTEGSLKEFKVTNVASKNESNILLDRGNFSYKWTANNTTALLENVNVDYKSQAHGSTNVNCKYAKFVAMGNKKFPSDIQLTLQTSAIKPAKTLRLGFELSDIKNSDNWEKRTEISSRYKKISVEEMLNALMSISK